MTRIPPRPRARLHRRQGQRGISLVLVLLFLIILTLVGLAASMSSLSSERMARNTRDQNIALQAAEAALRDARNDIRNIRFISGVTGAALTCDVAGFKGFCLPAVTGKPAWDLYLEDPARSVELGEITLLTADQKMPTGGANGVSEAAALPDRIDPGHQRRQPRGRQHQVRLPRQRHRLRGQPEHEGDDPGSRAFVVFPNRVAQPSNRWAHHETVPPASTREPPASRTACGIVPARRSLRLGGAAQPVQQAPLCRRRRFADGDDRSLQGSFAPPEGVQRLLRPGRRRHPGFDL